MAQHFRKPRSILITGASSGIGEALARAYAKPSASLALTGRDQGRLSETAAACRALGAEVTAHAVDVTDKTAMADVIGSADSLLPLDLVIANAGISAGTGDGSESEAQARQIFAVNQEGVLNTVLPALEPMRRRGHGQIAIMASLAGFRGVPGAPAYCASKAAVRVWGEALRGELASQGIAVSVICPGFVRSRMTDVNRFPMPFLVEADKAAAIIRLGLARNKARIAFPWPMAAAVWLLSTLPPALTESLLRTLPRKS